MADDLGPESPTNYQTLAKAILAGLTSNENISADGIRGVAVAAATQAHGVKINAIFKYLTEIGIMAGKGLANLEEPFMPIITGFAAPMVAGMFGTEVETAAFASRSNRDGRGAAAKAMVEAIISAITADAAEPSEPSDAGAKRVATAGLHAALEGWFLGAVPEILSDIFPFECGHFTAFTELPDHVIKALGVGRLVRSALHPLVNATAIQPMTWAANKKYRPTKLGTSTIVREYMRGARSYDELYESLTRDGYRDEDIDGLVNEQRKFLTLSDLAWLVWNGSITQDAAVQTLKDQGYDDQTASKLLNLQGLQREQALLEEAATAAASAYVNRRIDDGELQGVLSVAVPNAGDQATRFKLAQLKRSLNVKFLTPAEAESCVLAGILPLSEYRAALDRDGYEPNAADALEMLLRAKLDTKATAGQLKQQQADAKAAAANARAAATAQKKADVAAAAAVKAMGPIAEWEKAVVHGLVPIAQLEAVLSAHFDATTTSLYMADVEQQRAAYLDAQQRAADAAKRAAAKGLTTSQLETAVLDGILTPDEVRAQLTRGGLDAADVDVLVAEMTMKAADRAAAAKLHADAVAAAKVKAVNLVQAEQLVLAGHWTVAQYTALLSTLGYPPPDVANLVALLADRIAQQKAAAALRAAALAKSMAKGLSLAEFRASVILGHETVTSYQSFLVSDGYTAAAVATLVADVTDAKAAADAARATRQAAATARDGRLVPLSDFTRAARLGLIPPAAYQAVLVARGYHAGDVSMEMDLLAQEITATRAAAAAAAARAANAAAPGLPLSALATAVKQGAATIDAYAARAVQLGYRAADVQILTTTLADEVATLQAAQQRHVTIDGELTAKSLSLSEAEASVKAGSTTLDQYEAWLVAQGYGAGDAALLRALLEAKLPAPGA